MKLKKLKMIKNPLKNLTKNFTLRKIKIYSRFFWQYLFKIQKMYHTFLYKTHTIIFLCIFYWKCLTKLNYYERWWYCFGCFLPFTCDFYCANWRVLILGSMTDCPVYCVKTIRFYLWSFLRFRKKLYVPKKV